MALTSEIEKLEQRWRDNPQSRHFAPLADAYRKLGQFDRAIEVLTAGLEHHPAYASAHIVLGRTRMDMEEPVEAEAAFRRVLELDGENVIAIRALAEISAAADRLDEAEHWLNYLLSIDAGNDDARAQLNAVAERRSQQLAAPGPPPAEELEEPEEPEAPAEPAEAEPPPAAAGAAAEPEGGAMPEPGRLEGLQEPGGMEFVAPAAGGEDEADPAPEPAPPPEADWLPPEPEGLGAEPVTPWADEGMESPPPGPGSFEFGLERQEDIILHPSGASEFQGPDASQDLAPGAGPEEAGPAAEPPELPAWASEERWGENEWQTPPLPMEVPPDVPPAETPEEATGADTPAGEPSQDESPAAGAWTSLTEPGPVVERAPKGDGAGETPRAEPGPAPQLVEARSPGPQEGEEPPAPARAESESAGRRQLEDERAAAGAPMTEPELVVTQSMGDVYAAQGHRREALQVYRQLLERTPDDGRLRQKIEALSEPAVAPPPPVAHAASETGGQSVRDYFRSLLEPSPAEGETQAAPPEVATGPRDPDEAFGGEQGVGGAPTRPAAGPISLSDIFGEDSSPVPPVVPEGEGEPQGEGGGLSFDEFFGETPPPRPEAKPRPRTVRLSQAEEDDLEQFHNWLKGLKR